MARRKRIAKALAIFVVGSVVGVIAGFIVAGVLLPSDPTGRGAPGDGFLIILCVGTALAISFPLSLLAAARAIWPAKKNSN
jgi:hypothetical protein